MNIGNIEGKGDDMKNNETCEQYKIEYQNVDYNGKYKYADLLSRLSNLATKNAMEIGLWNESFDGKYGWVLVKQTVKLKRAIHVGEDLTVTTRAKGERKIQFFRTYDFKIDNEIVGGAYSIWTLIDLNKRRIVRPQKIGITMPKCEEYTSYVENYEPLLEIETKKQMTRDVLYSDVDLNKHMNNARYLEWVMDLIPDEIKGKYFIEQMTMHYLKEIPPHSKVDLYYGQKENDFRIEFKIDEQTYFEISGKLKEKSL